MTIDSTHPSLARLADKSICLVGLAREGLATYHFLRTQFPTLRLGLADQSPLEKLAPQWQAIRAQDQNLSWHLDSQFEKLVGKYSILFLTPGIPTTQPVVAAALAQGAELHSNTQLFFELCPCQTIGVTGTKGKSTTTSLIHHVLSSAGLPAVLLGNIGIPPLSALDQLTPESLAVVELSCHQLQHLTLSPHIAVIQDITREHLDYYPTIEAYVAAKAGITTHQAATDFVLFDPSKDKPCELAAQSKAQPLRFCSDSHHSGQDHTNCEVWLETSELIWHGERILTTAEIPLPGSHNIANVLPSIIIGKHYGLTNQQIADAIKSFRGLPQRLELVATVDQVQFYNDSLATEPNATISAIRAFADRPVILLAGGHERKQDYQELAAIIATSSVKALLLFPTTGQRLGELVSAELNQNPRSFIIKQVNSMEEAMEYAKQLAQAGDVVLLSPAAASFGMFKDYQERGEKFTVQALRRE